MVVTCGTAYLQVRHPDLTLRNLLPRIAFAEFFPCFPGGISVNCDESIKMRGSGLD